jgi:glutamine phosphoribosylpyrophosphate amidotransferase
MKQLKGSSCIGHNRYSTVGSSQLTNAQVHAMSHVSCYQSIYLSGDFSKVNDIVFVCLLCGACGDV